MGPSPAKASRPVNPDMVALARESRGLTQSDAASMLAISQARLSKIEAGLLSVPDDLCETMAEVFGYPARFFRLTDRVMGPGMSEFFHRRRQAASAKLLRRLHAVMNIRMINIARLLQAVEIGQDAIPRIDPDEFDGSVEDIARTVRAQWQLPNGAVKDVTRAIEDAGGIVVPCEFGSQLLDAMSRYVPGLPRMFFVDQAAPGDRERMSLAHELGHVVMHQIPHPDMETQAFRFAAEFLMPAKEIRPQFSKVDIPKLAAMKSYWKVSMAALLKRAEDLGTVSARRARYLWSQMSKAGYKTREPTELDIAPERPRLLQELVQVHRDDLGYGLAELSDLLVLEEREAQEIYEIEPTDADRRSRIRVVHSEKLA